MLLIDSHCHLDLLDLPQLGGDVDAVLETARAHDVGRMLCVSITLEQFPQVLALARRHEHVYASVGVHPNEREGREPTAAELISIAAGEDKIVAIGETGLDYYRAEDAPDWQRERFRRHIQAAAETGLPLIIHVRDAADDALRLLEEEGRGRVTGVMHCFTGDLATARAALDLGFYISFSGIVTFRNATALQAVAAEIPLDRLLIETDAPYLTPVPHRGKPNQPAYVRHVAEHLARLRGVDLTELAAATTENFLRLFRIAA